MRELLSLVPKPSRYLGIEEGTVTKNHDDVDVHIGLCFPDMYEVGMSYLGQKILYSIINEKENYWAERLFTPCIETGKILKEHNTPLSTLESDTPLAELDILSFHVTHELCYTNLLYVLDLGNIPFRTIDRGDSLTEYPVIIAGGGCTLAAEPIAPFMDLMTMGEGEEMMVELCDLLAQCKKENVTRHDFLRKASEIPGIYVPSFFEFDGPGKPLKPLFEDHTRPARRVVPDFNAAQAPITQPIPFGAVHSRYTLEIARGCTRGCRFCQAGMIYRPARERSTLELKDILEQGLTTTGYDDLSFLSLSTGDFSALKELFLNTVDRCSEEQISVSLPSLRVGSIDDEIMARMASIRRTGATLAPEAGSQRMRDVINKGVTEEQLLLHVRKLYQYGWQQVKLYFMIGLPTETWEDLDAIVELCRKVKWAAKSKGFQVTAGISPFVPKPHTPFQWEKQLTHEEITERIEYLREAFKKEKGMRMRWHEPDSSVLEGIFSRGDRRLADVVESAYNKGALFSSWVEHLNLQAHLDAMEEFGLNAADYGRERLEDEVLPWDHVNSGVTKEFLIRERKKSRALSLSEDCRYGKCHVCGSCDVGQKTSELDRLSEDTHYQNILNKETRDQEAHQPDLDEKGRIVQQKVSNKPPKLREELGVKAKHYRIWYTKQQESIFLSQLELQSLFERAMRRANLPMTFSQGFHPLPLISFGRALPVGVSSVCEWVNIFLREDKTPQEVFKALYNSLPRGMQPVKVEELTLSKKQPQAVSEVFDVTWQGTDDGWKTFENAFTAFLEKDEFLWTRETKKGERTADIRPILFKVKFTGDRTATITFDWTTLYISPVNLIRAVATDAGILDFALEKTQQHMP